MMVEGPHSDSNAEEQPSDRGRLRVVHRRGDARADARCAPPFDGDRAARSRARRAPRGRHRRLPHLGTAERRGRQRRPRPPRANRRQSRGWSRRLVGAAYRTRAGPRYRPRVRHLRQHSRRLPGDDRAASRRSTDRAPLRDALSAHHHWRHRQHAARARRATRRRASWSPSVARSAGSRRWSGRPGIRSSSPASFPSPPPARSTPRASL